MSRSGKLVLAVALSLCSCKSGPVAPQASSKNPTFILWEDLNDMHKRVGPPASNNVLTEFYMRQTTVGDVKVVVGLKTDDSRSHLNPTTRVGWLSFLFDKDVKLRDALGAIAELRALCAGNCDITGQTEGILHSARVTAPPHDEAEKQLVRSLAFASVGIKGEGAEKAQAAERAIFAVDVAYRNVPQEFDFENTPVSELTLSVTDPVQNDESAKLSRKFGGKLVNLTTYKP